MELFTRTELGYFVGLLVLCAALVGLYGLLSSKNRGGLSGPSRMIQILDFLLIFCFCSGLTGAGWWLSGQGIGLSEDFQSEGQPDPSMRQGSRRGRSHTGRGLHGGK